MNDIQLAVKALVDHYGSYRSAADAIDLNYAYLWRLRKGEKTDPSDEVLRKLGLVREVTYRKPGNGRSGK